MLADKTLRPRGLFGAEVQYRPTAAELLATLAQLLDDELLPSLPESLQHKTRVAANLCRILEREARLAPDAGRREHDLLAGLLGRDGDVSELAAHLATRLRTGAEPAFEARAWEVLVAVARDDLAIAKPGHDSWEGQ
jgi:hypothetical protein